MSESLPLDILFTIFTFLPLKYLVRFKCLSNSFRSLIDSLQLANSHQYDLNNHRKLIVADHHLDGFIYIIDLDTSPLTTPLNITCRQKPTVKTPDDFIPINHGGLFGSCNGVVAMYNEQGISLWNTSTNKFKSFPLWIVDIQLDGFGYDSVSYDYKVVMVTKLFSEDFLRVMIYSVKTNSLRRIQDLHGLEPFSTRLNYDHSGVLVGSFLHWVAHPLNERTAYHNFILAFDLRDEKFRKVPQPRDMIDVEDKVLNMVSELGGCLSLSYQFQGYVDIWIMKEYGVEKSWTKLVSVRSCQNSDYSFHATLKPLCYSKEGDKILMDYKEGKEIISYDLKNQTFDIIDIFKSSKYNKKRYGVFKSGFVCATTSAFPIVNGGSSSTCKKMPRKKNSRKS